MASLRILTIVLLCFLALLGFLELTGLGDWMSQQAPRDCLPDFGC
jgi:hypothetical protein